MCRAEKTSKLQTIPGTLDIAVDHVPLEHPSMCAFWGNASPLSASIHVPNLLSFCPLLPFCFSNLPRVWNSLFVCASRLCDILLCTGEALWRAEQTPAYCGGGRVCPGHHQVHAAAPRLQKPHLRLPQTPQIWQPEELRQGTSQQF